MNTPFLSVILLAGGSGNRMQSSTPKQFMPLGDKPVILHSLDVFLSMQEVSEIIVVCDEAYRHHFHAYRGLKWALPGERRQDSAYNGFQQVATAAAYVCVHDACRPFIDSDLVCRVFKAACENGASAAGMPLKFTVKQINSAGLVVDTPDRSFFWEIQTPQILRTTLLKQGFEKAYAENLSVTDDTSLAELIGAPVKLVKGAYRNIKITTPDDLPVAHNLLGAHG